MALVSLRREENVEGDFYVDSTCIDCDLCRQIAPESFSAVGEQSAVHRQPSTPEEEMAALKALVTCPTASIGALGDHPVKAAVEAYPEQVEDEVYFCGFAAESSFGASSYFVKREGGNLLVDSPRFARPLARRIESMGGVRWIFLTHQDDVADQDKWAAHFKAERIMHRDDIKRHITGIEHVITGRDAVAFDDDLTIIPTPGHTRGHMVLLYRDRFLFSGDHIWWSDTYKSLYASPNVSWYSYPEQARSVELLLNYSFEWVLPGHGRRAHADARRMRGYVEECLARMKKHPRLVAG